MEKLKNKKHVFVFYGKGREGKTILANLLDPKKDIYYTQGVGLEHVMNTTFEIFKKLKRDYLIIETNSSNDIRLVKDLTKTNGYLFTLCEFIR